MSETRRVVYVMSTNYAGSTLLGLVLGAHPEIGFLGEPALALRKRADGSWRHKRFCAKCRDNPCPVWTKDRIAAIRKSATPHHEATRAFPDARILVDGSKSLPWLDEARGAGIEDVAVIHISKSVEAFAASVRTRAEKPRHVTFVARDWARQNRHIRELAVRRGFSYLHLRYDELATDPQGTIDRLGRFVGFAPHADQYDPFGNAGHHIKGNPGIAKQTRANSEKPRIRLDDKWRKTITPFEVDAMRALPEVGRESRILNHPHPSRDRLPLSWRIGGQLAEPSIDALRFTYHRLRREFAR